MTPHTPVLALVVTGPGDSVVIGTSSEGFEAVDALPELTSLGFALRNDEGQTVQVPEGIALRVGANVSARRRGIDRRDDDGIVRTHYTYELASGTRLFAQASWVLDGVSPYRGGPRLVRDAAWVHLATTAEDLRDPRFSRRSGIRGAVIFGATLVVVVATTIAGTVLR